MHELLLAIQLTSQVVPNIQYMYSCILGHRYFSPTSAKPSGALCMLLQKPPVKQSPTAYMMRSAGLTSLLIRIAFLTARFGRAIVAR